MYPSAPDCQLSFFNFLMSRPDSTFPIARRLTPWATPIGRSIQRGPLVLGAVAGISGIAMIDQGRTGLFAIVALLLAGWIAWLRYHRSALTVIAAGALVALLLLGWRQHERLAGIHAFPLAHALEEGNAIRVEGEGWIADSVDQGERSISTMMQLERLVIGGRELICDHRVPVWVQKLPGSLDYGTSVRFTGRLLPLEGPAVPGAFDAKAFYFRQSGSLGKLEIAEGDSFVRLEHRRGAGLVRYALRLRGQLEEGLLLGISKEHEPYARLIAAMALGAREHSPEELEEYFRISGTMHLFAVSGLNVAILAGMLTWIAAAFGVPRSRAVPVIIPLVLFYAVLTGLSPSAVRAALMASAFLAGYSLREKPRLLNSLGFAALLLLAWDPQPLFLPGFQLSFAVLVFIALFAPLLSDRLAKPFLVDPFVPQSLIRPARRTVDRITGSIAALFAVSIASWLGSLGLLAWHFQSVSPVGILANVFMVPVAGVVMGLAAASLVTYGLHLTWLTLVANRLNVIVSILMTSMAQFFSSLPGAMIHTGRERPHEGKDEVLRLDLVGERGEGATLLEIPNGRPSPLLWMIDSGGDRTYQGRILPLMRSRGLNRIDALVLTHGDEGHLGAAPAAIHQFRPGLLLESAVENRSPTHREILEMAQRFGVTPTTLDRGQRLLVGDQVSITVLHPSSLRPGRLADDRALVLKIDYAGRSLLLTSDSGFETERTLLESGADLRADLWIRGQHADAPSGLTTFVDAIAPKAVISSHAEFPESERISQTLRDHLAARQIPLYDLESAGTVAVEITSDGVLRLAPYAGSEPARSFP
jgi:ComEC/Rec2-related protein